MTLFSRTATLPLGVDIATESVSIVCSSTASGEFSIRETRTVEVSPAGAGQLDRNLAEAVRTIVNELETRERRCVLAAPSVDLVTRTFRVPPKMNRAEAERAASLEADSLVDWTTPERLIALDPFPDRHEEMLLSVARTSTIERIVAIARAGGLQPVAVDVPVCAWRRAIPDADAILDCSRDRAELVIFGTPLGASHAYPPRLVDDRLAGHVRAALVDARRDGIADVTRLAILGSQFRYESLEPLLRDDGYTIAPVVLADTLAPAWTFAFGLSSWAVAPRGRTAS